CRDTLGRLLEPPDRAAALPVRVDLGSPPQPGRASVTVPLAGIRGRVGLERAADSVTVRHRPPPSRDCPGDASHKPGSGRDAAACRPQPVRTTAQRVRLTPNLNPRDRRRSELGRADQAEANSRASPRVPSAAFLLPPRRKLQYS